MFSNRPPATSGDSGANAFSSFTLTEDLVVTATSGAPASIAGWAIAGTDGDVYEIYGYIEAVNDAGVANTVGIDDDLTSSQSALLVSGARQQAGGAIAVIAFGATALLSAASSLAAGATAKTFFSGHLIFRATATSQLTVYQTSTQATLKAGSKFYYRKLHP